MNKKDPLKTKNRTKKKKFLPCLLQQSSGISLNKPTKNEYTPN